jgi:hypothetical protein
MTRSRAAQRAAEWLIRRACRRLPGDARDERYREWAAEVPAILHDPELRFAVRRSARALRFAAGTFTSARRSPGAIRYRPDAAAFASAGVRLLISVGIWIVGVGVLTAFPPHGLWIVVTVAAGVLNSGFAAIQEVKLVLLFCRLGTPD